jgi:hypothetical protein
MSREEIKAATEEKPGYKTSEFWLSFVAVLVSFAMSSGLVIEGSHLMQALGLIAAALSAMGYGYSRAKTKEAASHVKAMLMAPPTVITQAAPPVDPSRGSPQD